MLNIKKEHFNKNCDGIHLVSQTSKTLGQKPSLIGKVFPVYRVLKNRCVKNHFEPIKILNL